jgi:hypothetical protein
LKRVAAALIVTLLSLFWIGQAAAHSMRESTVAVDVGGNAILVESEWPVEELELALREPLNSTGDRLTDVQQRLLLDYGSRHVWIEELHGDKWPREKDDVRLEQYDGHNQIIYRAVYRQPRDITSRAARLHYDAITHEVMSHAALIYTRTHARPNALKQAENPVAVIQNPTTGVELKLAHRQAKGMSANLIGSIAAALLMAAFFIANLVWKRRKSARSMIANEAKFALK